MKFTEIFFAGVGFGVNIKRKCPLNEKLGLWVRVMNSYQKKMPLQYNKYSCSASRHISKEAPSLKLEVPVATYSI